MSSAAVSASASPDGAGASAPGTPPTNWGLAIGSSFPAENGKYVIKAEIDDGGMGIVYEAHQGELGVVAIKVIKPRILGQAASERFLNEARAMAKVRAEPGIATIYDCDSYTDAPTGTRAPFIVMEYVPGALPITTYANEHKLGLRARLALFERVCAAMGAAHRADIIHRDLKPSNVLVDANGHVKVIDFGLALVHDPAENARKLPSERGGLFGTLEYMSPEQAAKRFDPHVLTPASDVYSLGAILYELLLGKLPYVDHPADAVKKTAEGTADYTEATRIIREEAPVPPHKLNRGIRPGVEAILLRALAKDPSKRYRTAGEMSAAIARELKWGRKRDLLVAAPIVVVAAWLAGVISVPWLFLDTPINTFYMRAAAALEPSITSFKHVLLVTADETTPLEGFEPLAVENHNGLGFGNGQRTRPLIGRLCEKLASSGCRVVALDGYYTSDAILGTGDDDALLKGVKALQKAGIDWVMGTPEWEDRLEASPRVVRESGAVKGGIWIHADPAAWYLQAALQRDQRVSPSFALVAAAVYRHPGRVFAFNFAKESFGVYCTALKRDGSEPVNDASPIPMSRVVGGNSPEVSKPLRGSSDTYKAGDRVAILQLPPIPSDAVLDVARVDAGAIMKMTDGELRAHCGNKVVVIANAHHDYWSEEWAPTPDGRMLPASFGHALGIETLLRGVPTMRSVDYFKDLATMLLGASLGAGIALGLRWRPIALMAAGVAGAIGMVAVSLAVVALGGMMLNPILPIVAMILALVISSMIIPMTANRMQAIHVR
jgi:serine/threonine protein kinase